MFYSVLILGKKGPLARIWLAAHWDKKITKAQILETNIVESIDAILQTRTRLSLRTSSHLLLGVVRIYSRKAYYLLQDCQDAAFKIKSAFRPGAVDLPENKLEAAVSAITLPEMLDFVSEFDVIADPPFQHDIVQTNANVRNITLSEDISSLHVDDRLLSDVRDWIDFSSKVDSDSAVNIKDGSSIHPDKDQENAHPLDIFDRPPVDDGFGGPLGIGDVDDMFALPVPPEAQEQMQAEKDKLDEENRPSSRLSTTSTTSYGNPLSAAPSAGPSTPGSVPPPPIDDEEMPEDDQFKPPEKQDEPNILDENIENGNALGEEDVFRQPKPATQDTMVLEPLNEGPNLERKRKRRKKLGIVIDEVKTLSGEEMKAQLSDTGDIITTLELAPPTKKLMHWKRTCGTEKLFSLPERPIPSKLLLALYTEFLTTKQIENEEPLPDEEELLNGDYNETDDLSHKRQAITQEENYLSNNITDRLESEDNLQMPPPPSPLKEIQPPKTPRTPRRTDGEHKSPTKKRKTSDKERKERTKTINHHEKEKEKTQEKISASTIRNEPLPQIEDDFDDHYEYEQPMSVGPPEEMMPDETSEQFEERMRNKRSNMLLRQMARSMSEDDTVIFSKLAINHRRKQVAQMFYSLLVLKKQLAIELQQDKTVPYGEITISQGMRYEEALARSSKI